MNTLGTRRGHTSGEVACIDSRHSHEDLDDAILDVSSWHELGVAPVEWSGLEQMLRRNGSNDPNGLFDFGSWLIVERAVEDPLIVGGILLSMVGTVLEFDLDAKRDCLILAGCWVTLGDTQEVPSS